MIQRLMRAHPNSSLRERRSSYLWQGLHLLLQGLYLLQVLYLLLSLYLLLQGLDLLLSLYLLQHLYLLHPIERVGFAADSADWGETRWERRQGLRLLFGVVGRSL